MRVPRRLSKMFAEFAHLLTVIRWQRLYGTVLSKFAQERNGSLQVASARPAECAPYRQTHLRHKPAIGLGFKAPVGSPIACSAPKAYA